MFNRSVRRSAGVGSCLIGLSAKFGVLRGKSSVFTSVQLQVSALQTGTLQVLNAGLDSEVLRRRRVVPLRKGDGRRISLEGLEGGLLGVFYALTLKTRMGEGLSGATKC